MAGSDAARKSGTEGPAFVGLWPAGSVLTIARTEWPWKSGVAPASVENDAAVQSRA
jgi:hypothetical protein